MSSETNQIKIKALGLFQHNGRVLACPGYDPVKDEHYYRLLGGTMEFFETGEETMRREIQEELKSDIEDLQYLGLVENRFEYKGERGHQITFLYSGNLANKDLYSQEKIPILDTKASVEAEWVLVKDILEGRTKLYPPFEYEKYLA